jgi:excinuclease ABC subunit A
MWAKNSSASSTGKTLYILDEPTTGLSFEDTRALLVVLQRLVDAGNTVVVIEHHIDVMKNADHIIDLGPLGGDRGGRLIAEGTPEEVALNDESFTARYLRQVLPADRIAAAKRAKRNAPPSTTWAERNVIGASRAKGATKKASQPSSNGAAKGASAKPATNRTSKTNGVKPANGTSRTNGAKPAANGRATAKAATKTKAAAARSR